MIDTIQIAHDLTAGSSLSQKDAEAVVQTIVKMQTSELASKADIAELRAATKLDIAELRAATKVDIAEVRTEIAKVKADLIYWIVGSVGLSTLLQLAASFLRR